MGIEGRHLTSLGRSPWRMWRECVLRSAGFPAAGIDALGDPPLADLARQSFNDPAAREQFLACWPAAVDRSRAAARGFAREHRFREAVTWQNPALVRGCLDVTRLRRKHELAIASYAQRYLLKNDTIGFFGPLAWARWTDGGPPLRVRPGAGLLARRAVFFETWAIDAVADRLATGPGVEPWLRPRMDASALLVGTTLHRAYGGALALTAQQAALLSRCDGSHSVRQLATQLAMPLAATLAQLRAWRDDGTVHLGLDGPVSARPEVELRSRLDWIGDTGTRQQASAVLAELVQARDAVAAAGGDASAVAAALADLAGTFERITGRLASRRPGQAYAGRTLVYEDAQRDVTVELGQPLAERLAGPLSLLLDSATWLVAAAADHYERLLRELFDRCARQMGATSVPLAMLVAAASPHLRGSRPGPIGQALAEFQQRWARVLAVPAGARRHTVSADAIAERVRRELPRRSARWAAAVHYSPDLLVAAMGDPPWSADDLTVVLGELHLARNTLENRPLVEFHDEPARLLDALAADHGTRRVYHLPPKQWPQVSPRTYPSPLLPPQFTYWSLYDHSSAVSGPVLPAAALTVHPDRERLRVRSQAAGVDLDVMEVLGEQLTNAVINAFRLFPEDRHRPRVTIDSLVAQRESWVFDSRQVSWAEAAERAERFRLAQAWQAANHLPDRVFCKVVGEKPTFVDFRSVALVEVLARTVQRAARGRFPERLWLTELLPDLDQNWLADAAGNRYTAEIRCVMLAPGTGAATTRARES